MFDYLYQINFFKMFKNLNQRGINCLCRTFLNYLNPSYYEPILNLRKNNERTTKKLRFCDPKKIRFFFNKMYTFYHFSLWIFRDACIKEVRKVEIKFLTNLYIVLKEILKRYN